MNGSDRSLDLAVEDTLHVPWWGISQAKGQMAIFDQFNLDISTSTYR